MSKKLVPTLCLFALSVACSGSGGGSTTTTTGGSGSTGGSTSSTSSSGGSSGNTGCTPVANIAALRKLPDYSAACVNNVTVVEAEGFGAAVDGGGTQYTANWILSDSTGIVSVYHSKKYSITQVDPVRGDLVNLADGKISIYPTADAGGGQQVQVSGDTLQFTEVTPGGGTLPTALTPTWADLTAPGPTNPNVGQFVHVPAGMYTENYKEPAFQYMSYQDGVSLTLYPDGGGGKLYVNVFDFSFSTGDNLPTDGGMPDLAAGGFDGAFDTVYTDDNESHNVLYYAAGGT